MKDKRLNTLEQQKYRSGVGMLFYLVKHSRPDLSNPVRELTKVMDGARVDHMTSLFREIKFALHTRDRGIMIKPNS
jgi:hypothetical protein